jgi:hypothetical protein
MNKKVMTKRNVNFKFSKFLNIIFKIIITN